MVPHVESNNCIGAPVISGRTKTCTDVFFLSSFRFNNKNQLELNHLRGKSKADAVLAVPTTVNTLRFCSALPLVRKLSQAFNGVCILLSKRSLPRKA